MTISQDTLNNLIAIGFVLGVVIVGIVIGVKQTLMFFNKHFQTNVTTPIVESMNEVKAATIDVKEAVLVQREAYTDALNIKTQALVDLQRQADNSIADRDQLRRDMAEIRDKQRHRDDTITELTRKVDSLETALSSKDADLADARHTITILNQKLAEANQLEGRVDELQNRVNALEEQVKTMLAREEQLTQENNDLKQQLIHKDEQLIQKDELLTQRDAQIAALKKELEALKAATAVAGDGHATATAVAG